VHGLRTWKDKRLPGTCFQILQRLVAPFAALNATAMFEPLHYGFFFFGKKKKEKRKKKKEKNYLFSFIFLG
jgi:hypothetical protein